MYPRIEYEMIEKDLEKILNACKPTPVLFGNNGINLGGSQQEKANRAWKTLGKKMGFDSMTVRPIQGKCNRFFTAVPLETEEQRKERETKEAEERRLKRISDLKIEIADREKELKDLG